MIKLDIGELQFKNIISGPAPMGRILNYVKHAGADGLWHKNGYRYTNFKNNIGYAWTTEYMLGLGLVSCAVTSNSVPARLELTTKGHELYVLISKYDKTFTESSDAVPIVKQMAECNQRLYYVYKQIFIDSVPFKILKLYLSENGYSYNGKKKFMNDYFETVKNIYDTDSTPYNRDARTSTADNRVPSLMQHCVAFGLLNVDGSQLEFDKDAISGMVGRDDMKIVKNTFGRVAEMPEAYEWTVFYSKFADKLLEYKDKRQELIQKIHNVIDKLDPSLNVALKVSNNKDRDLLSDIDPFTIFAWFNQYENAKRIAIIEGLIDEFKISGVTTPTNFVGVPKLTPMNIAFFTYRDNPKYSPNDIQNLWNIFEIAIELSANFHDKAIRKRFELSFDTVVTQCGVGRRSLTMGLFWARPYYYISLDDRNNKLISSKYAKGESLAYPNRETITGEQYLGLLGKIYELLGNEIPCKTIPELSYYAYTNTIKPSSPNIEPCPQKGDEQEHDNNPLGDFTLEEDSNLTDVYIDSKYCGEMVSVLTEKKNIILQGPPGVGKTFVARKIVANLKGKGEGSDKDGNVYSKFIQFHQNYSYEDFVMGYRPKSDGSFEMSYGIFYRFCKAAKNYPQHKFVFIIDEINRGNVSNIFGELLMLIEADKRASYSATLAYKDKDGKDERFSVPENVYIIGMMNTADRSLALIDYALRRRFSFFEIEPAFDNLKFKELIRGEKTQTLVNIIKEINKEIEESLGKGFKIGHSYFCKESLDEEQLKRIVKYDIMPLLEEYWFDEPKKIDECHTKLKDYLSVTQNNQ